MVEMVARTGHPAVVEYKVTVTAGSSKHGCVVKAGTTPLSCWVGGLTPATAYSVSAVACLPNNAGCGPAAGTQGATIPNGKFYYTITLASVQWSTLP